MLQVPTPRCHTEGWVCGVWVCYRAPHLAAIQKDGCVGSGYVTGPHTSLPYRRMGVMMLLNIFSQILIGGLRWYICFLIA
ncbi:hypothetical protein FKM82_025078 [Ascaphus truei]